MKRKLLSMILVVAMLASMLVIVPVSGATESRADLAFSDTVGVAGDVVTVDLTIKTALLQGLQIMFEYDASRLTFEKIEWTSAEEHGGVGFAADLTNNTEFQYFTAAGPYKVLAWATGQGVGALDLSQGATLATLTFTIKEDAPLGNADISFTPLANPNNAAVITNKINPGNADDSFGFTEMTFDNGVVTVLPEDCASNFIIPGENEWDFDEGDLFGVLNGELLSASGTLVIPAEIGGVAVTFIDEKALSGGNWSSIIVPASVESMAGFAIHACENLKSVYILGADTELDAVAIGFSGNRTSRAEWIMNDDGTAPLTKIVAPAGSAAETYANTAETDNNSKVFTHPFAALGGKVTANGISYYAPAVTKAPGMMETADGKLVVAWTDGVNTYSAGAPMTLTGDVTLEAAKTIAKPQTTTELDFKLAPFYAEDGETRLEKSDLSMRFKATFSVADYATLADLAGEEGSVQLGMLITPAKYVALAGSFTKEALGALKGTNGVALGANAYVNVAIESYMSKTATDYVFGARLANFSADTLAKNPDFAAVMYATVTTADGTVFTVYGDFNLAANRNVKAVAQTIHDDPARDLTTTQKGWLSDLIGSFN